MKENHKKIENHFTSSMVLEGNSEVNNDENLKSISTSLIKEFVKNNDLLAKNETKTDLDKRKPLLVGFAIASGNNRAKKVIKLALLPLLNNNRNLEKTKSISLLISSHTIEIDIDEIGIINDYIQEKVDYQADIIMSVNQDENLDEALAVTLILSDNIKHQ
jgi:cell division GTPase FtsZ